MEKQKKAISQFDERKENKENEKKSVNSRETTSVRPCQPKTAAVKTPSRISPQ
jgi:hypothetical protein